MANTTPENKVKKSIATTLYLLDDWRRSTRDNIEGDYIHLVSLKVKEIYNLFKKVELSDEQVIVEQEDMNHS